MKNSQFFYISNRTHLFIFFYLDSLGEKREGLYNMKNEMELENSDRYKKRE